LSKRWQILCAAASIALAPLAQAQMQILACVPKSKQAVGPQDALDCEPAAGEHFNSNLGQLYAQGWRLVSATFFSGNQEVLYLEKAEPVAPSAP